MGFSNGSETKPHAFFYFIPENAHIDTPVIVSVHGISRNAVQHLFRWLPLARAAGFALVCPLFEKDKYGQYQQLFDSASKQRSDMALIDILDDFQDISQINCQKIYLSGFSGGAQFAHRFAMKHADRVQACILCAAGWYSLPDETIGYPYGTGNFEVHHQWSQVPITLFVGQRDKSRDASLNRQPIIDQSQGRHRLARAKTWARALEEQRAKISGASVALITIPDVGHDFSDILGHAQFTAPIMNLFTPSSELKA